MWEVWKLDWELEESDAVVCCQDCCSRGWCDWCGCCYWFRVTNSKSGCFLVYNCYHFHHYHKDYHAAHENYHGGNDDNDDPRGRSLVGPPFISLTTYQLVKQLVNDDLSVIILIAGNLCTHLYTVDVDTFSRNRILSLRKTIFLYVKIELRPLVFYSRLTINKTSLL